MIQNDAEFYRISDICVIHISYFSPNFLTGCASAILVSACWSLLSSFQRQKIYESGVDILLAAIWCYPLRNLIRKTMSFEGNVRNKTPSSFRLLSPCSYLSVLIPVLRPRLCCRYFHAWGTSMIFWYSIRSPQTLSRKNRVIAFTSFLITTFGTRTSGRCVWNPRKHIHLMWCDINA